MADEPKTNVKIDDLPKPESQELTPDEAKDVQGGFTGPAGIGGIDIRPSGIAGNTIGGALGSDVQNTVGGALGDDVIRTADGSVRK